MTSPKISPDVQKLIRSFGLNYTTVIVNYQWTGQDQLLRATSDSALLHELAHYSLASPARRSKPEFDLGRAPDAKTGSYTPQFFNDMEEELEASLLGIAYEAEFGMPFWVALEEANWTMYNPFEEHPADGFFNIIGKLLQKGFLNQAGRPTHLIRTWED